MRARHGGYGCTVTEAELDDSTPLRLTADGPELATLRGGAARLELNAKPQRLELENTGVLLRTPYQPTDRPLHLREPIALLGVLTPKADARVDWLRSDASGEWVRFSAGPELKQAKAEDRVACDQIGLNTPTYELPDPPEGTQVDLVGKVQVVASPGSATGLALDAEDSLRVLEVERKGGFSKILVEMDDARLLGWVPAAVVRHGVTPMGRGGGGWGAGGLGLRGRSSVNYTHCPTELPLHAAHGSERGEVGLIRAGTGFEVDERISTGPHAGWVAIDFWQSWIYPKHGTLFLIPEESLAGCK